MPHSQSYPVTKVQVSLPQPHLSYSGRPRNHLLCSGCKVCVRRGRGVRPLLPRLRLPARETEALPGGSRPLRGPRAHRQERFSASVSVPGTVGHRDREPILLPPAPEKPLPGGGLARRTLPNLPSAARGAAPELLAGEPDHPEPLLLRRLLAGRGVHQAGQLRVRGEGRALQPLLRPEAGTDRGLETSFHRTHTDSHCGILRPRLLARPLLRKGRPRRGPVVERHPLPSQGVLPPVLPRLQVRPGELPAADGGRQTAEGPQRKQPHRRVLRGDAERLFPVEQRQICDAVRSGLTLRTK
ncbi:unnamed protein product [Larinioides sclopetarius]|uniref:Uncharacterized protein n=1 Tax=Larinioides sclopetarius TaxID=280406 RepID=A0AAV2BZ55_9ARAC